MPTEPNQRIGEIIRHLDQDRELPTLSPVVEKILRLIGDEKISIKELAGVIEKDVSLSLKMLKVVNSAYYGFTRKISTLSQAMVILGLSAVKNLALSMSIMEIFSKGTALSGEESNFKVFWERSLFSAVTAKKLAKQIKYQDEEEAFVAALLQDIGVLVFIKYYPEEYAELLARAKKQALDIVTLEEKQFGINHALLGEFFANKWQLPRTLTMSILRHHEPEGIARGGRLEEIQKLTHMVHLSYLISNIFYEEYHPERSTNLVKQAKNLLDLDQEFIDDLLNNLAEEVNEVAEFFGISLKGTRSYSELLMAANMELGKLNFSYERMNRELVVAKRRAEDLAAQLAEANRKLEELANLDGLTKIFNRRVFQNLITREFYRSTRYGNPLTCIMIDLDHFKEINDKQGHLVGDQVLREVAALLASKLRQSDFLARYGGEEFVVISPEADEKDAAIIGERLRQTVEQAVFDVEGRSIKMTISLGAATYTKDSEMKVEDDLIAGADKNLYLAKNNGRNRCWTDQDTLDADKNKPVHFEQEIIVS